MSSSFPQSSTYTAARCAGAGERAARPTRRWFTFPAPAIPCRTTGSLRRRVRSQMAQDNHGDSGTSLWRPSIIVSPAAPPARKRKPMRGWLSAMPANFTSRTRTTRRLDDARTRNAAAKSRALRSSPASYSGATRIARSESGQSYRRPSAWLWMLSFQSPFSVGNCFWYPIGSPPAGLWKGFTFSAM